MVCGGMHILDFFQRSMRSAQDQWCHIDSTTQLHILTRSNRRTSVRGCCVVATLWMSTCSGCLGSWRFSARRACLSSCCSRAPNLSAVHSKLGHAWVRAIFIAW